MSSHFGMKLAGFTDVSQDHQGKLRDLNITSAEQLVALAAIADTKEGLAKHLGVTAKAVDELVDKAKSKLPKRVVAAMEEPYIEHLGVGALEPPANMRMKGPGPYERAVSIAALPANVNYIARMPAIRNQGPRGTCVAFACTALNEDYQRYTASGQPDLSEQCLYNRCKANDGFPNDEGTWVRVGMDCLVTFGESSEACEPYNPNLPTNQPGPHSACCAQESPNWRIPRSLQLNQNSVADIKAALADGKVVAFAIPVYHSWYDSAAVRRTGDITMPLPGERSFAGHAMLFVGYQDDTNTPGGGYFIFRNSWGTTSWGASCTYGAGYGTLPYQYMTSYGWEAYATDAAVAPCPPRPYQPVCPPRPYQPICPPRPYVLCPPRPYQPVCPPRAFQPLCPPRPVIMCPPQAYSPVCPAAPTPGPYDPYGPMPDPYMQSYNWGYGGAYGAPGGGWEGWCGCNDPNASGWQGYAPYTWPGWTAFPQGAGFNPQVQQW